MITNRNDKGLTFVQLSIGMAMFGLVAGTVVPGYQTATERAQLAAIKANMYEVRLGIERYAADHQGVYPIGVQDDRFNWRAYVNQKVQNPFNLKLLGVANMERDVVTSMNSTPTSEVAVAYSKPGVPGGIRYFTDRDHYDYSLIGYDKTGRPIKESPSRNFELHN